MLKKLALAFASVVVVLLPVSASAVQPHHDDPTSQSRNIDWD